MFRKINKLKGLTSKRIKNKVNKVLNKVSFRRFIYHKIIPYIASYLYDEFKIYNKIVVNVNDAPDSYFYCPDVLPGNPILYSVGIGNNINFELAMINQCGAEVFSFDPTLQSRRFIESINLPKKLNFFNVGIGGEDGNYPSTI